MLILILKMDKLAMFIAITKLKKIRDRKYILPEKKATQNAISLTENIDKKLLALLNIGKKAYFLKILMI